LYLVDGIRGLFDGNVFPVSEAGGKFRLLGFQHCFVFVEFGLVHFLVSFLAGVSFLIVLFRTSCCRTHIDGISRERFQLPVWPSPEYLEPSASTLPSTSSARVQYLAIRLPNSIPPTERLFLTLES